MAYSEKMLSETPRLVFDENLYTAPASISGLPAAVAGGVQLIGPAFSENVLLDIAAIIEKGGQKI
jgi:Asp-tRNA(Asn)/Glu-tRNA(Gln) amidotransferase A subunit family amidase